MKYFVYILKILVSILILPFAYIYAWIIINDLCHKHRIANMPIICPSVLRDEVYGLYNYKRNIIYFDTIRCLMHRHVLITLRHEFRHAWQNRYFSDMSNWWNNHHDIYNDFYNTSLCVIEVDARRFAENGNTDSYILESVSIDELEYAYQNNLLENLSHVVHSRQKIFMVKCKD